MLNSLVTFGDVQKDHTKFVLSVPCQLLFHSGGPSEVRGRQVPGSIESSCPLENRGLANAHPQPVNHGSKSYGPEVGFFHRPFLGDQGNEDDTKGFRPVAFPFHEVVEGSKTLEKRVREGKKLRKMPTVRSHGFSGVHTLEGSADIRSSNGRQNALGEPWATRSLLPKSVPKAGKNGEPGSEGAWCLSTAVVQLSGG